MPADPNFAQTAALIGDPTRAAILGALLGGKAQTASELAHSAGVTPQTASMHLARLVEGRVAARGGLGAAPLLPAGRAAGGPGARGAGDDRAACAHHIAA